MRNTSHFSLTVTIWESATKYWTITISKCWRHSHFKEKDFEFKPEQHLVQRKEMNNWSSQIGSENNKNNSEIEPLYQTKSSCELFFRKSRYIQYIKISFWGNFLYWSVKPTWLNSCKQKRIIFGDSIFRGMSVCEFNNEMKKKDVYPISDSRETLHYVNLSLESVNYDLGVLILNLMS